MLNPDRISDAEPLAAVQPPERPKGAAALARRWGLRLVPLLLLAAAGVVLWREFHHLSLGDITDAMRAWGVPRILIATALSAFSFSLMGVVEWLGLRWTGARVPWQAALNTSFLANAIAHSVGANLLVSGALRARLYSRFGVNLTQVAATTLFSGFSFGVGLATLGGSGLLFSPAAQIQATALPLSFARGLGGVLLSLPAAYVLLCAVAHAPLTIFGRTLRLPSARDAAAQVAVGVVDNAVAAAIIWLLLPTGAVHYPTFVGAYAMSTVAGLVSSVPGGAGVFEGSISALLPHAERAPLAAAFLGYRLTYYIGPLLLACALLAMDTARRRGR